MFLPQPFSNGLARLPRNFFWGSLIPNRLTSLGKLPFNLQAEAIGLSDTQWTIEWKTDG